MVEMYTATVVVTIIGFGMLLLYLLLFCFNNTGKKRRVIPPHLYMNQNRQDPYQMNPNWNFNLPPSYIQSQEQERLRNNDLPLTSGAALGRVPRVPVNPWISRISSSEPVDF